jgi:hypothetical protein
VPRLTTSRVRLRVLYEFGISGLPVLQSEWSSIEYSFDRPGAEPPDDEVELWVTGVEASPEQCGVWAARWFERQLHRPVVRRERDRPTSGVASLVPGTTSGPVAVEWTVGEPDRILHSRGGLRWWWLPRQPPHHARLWNATRETAPGSRTGTSSTWVGRRNGPIGCRVV